MARQHVVLRKSCAHPLFFPSGISCAEGISRLLADFNSNYKCALLRSQVKTTWTASRKKEEMPLVRLGSREGETHLIPVNLYLNVRSGFTGRL